MCVNSTTITNRLVRFFDRFVKGEQNGFEATPHMEIWHETTGAADAEPTWVTTNASWPPATETKLRYLGSGPALTAAQPSRPEPADSYGSPAVPAGTEA